jgi:hypothetical protein
MCGAIPPLPQYAFMSWCSVKVQGHLYLYLKRRWEDNIRMDLREIGWEDVDWIHLAQDRNQWRAVINTVMNPRV